MIDKTLRKATAERHGPVVVVRYTGGGDHERSRNREGERYEN